MKNLKTQYSKALHHMVHTCHVQSETRNIKTKKGA